MSTKPVDRRVRRTRQLLRHALMALILEKGYDAVTVQEITDRANLGRATFYLHYKDKDDLLAQSLESVFADLVERVDPQQRSLDHSPALLAFEHAAENSQFYQVILSGQGSHSVFRKVRDYIANQVQLLLGSHLAAAEIPTDLLANYMAGALLSLLAWWLENDMPYTPQQMARTYRQLMFLGLAELTGIDREWIESNDDSI